MKHGENVIVYDADEPEALPFLEGVNANVFHAKKTCQVIALNYAYKEKGGAAKKPYRWFINKCMAGDAADHIHVPSNLYADRIAQEFHYDRDKIIVRPFGI